MINQHEKQMMKNSDQRKPQAFNIPGWVENPSLLKSSSSFGPEPQKNNKGVQHQLSTQSIFEHYTNLKTSTLKKTNQPSRPQTQNDFITHNFDKNLPVTSFKQFQGLTSSIMPIQPHPLIDKQPHKLYPKVNLNQSSFDSSSHHNLTSTLTQGFTFHNPAIQMTQDLKLSQSI